MSLMYGCFYAFVPPRGADLHKISYGEYMKTLILSCNTGEGHNSCARAIKEYYNEKGEVCDIEDSLRFVSQKISNIFSKWHVRIYRYAPKLFDRGYIFLEDHPGASGDRSALHKLFAAGSRKLADFIREGGYDNVICTHTISSTILTDAMRRHGLSLRASSLLVTDYTCHPMANESGLDLCFMPDVSLADEFVSRGVPRDKLVPSGIPVRHMFFSDTEKAKAKETLGIPRECRHLLVMCGSMGCGPIHALARDIVNKMPKNAFMTVICGTNKKLFAELSEEYAGIPNVRVLGFTGEIGTLMDSADLYLTKPGGISTTEAAVKRLPMVFVNAVAGCEDGNLAFFVAHGGAVTDDDLGILADKCVSLLSDGAALDEMSQNLGALGFGDASAVIYERMHALSGEPAMI